MRRQGGQQSLSVSAAVATACHTTQLLVSSHVMHHPIKLIALHFDAILHSQLGTDHCSLKSFCLLGNNFIIR